MTCYHQESIPKSVLSFCDMEKIKSIPLIPCSTIKERLINQKITLFFKKLIHDVIAETVNPLFLMINQFFLLIRKYKRHNPIFNQSFYHLVLFFLIINYFFVLIIKHKQKPVFKKKVILAFTINQKENFKTYIYTISQEQCRLLLLMVNYYFSLIRKQKQQTCNKKKELILLYENLETKLQFIFTPY